MAKTKTKVDKVETSEVIEAVDVTEETVEEVVVEPTVLKITNCSQLNVRNKPNGDIIDIANLGTVFTKVEDEGKWTKVLYNGKTAYVMTEYVTEA